MDADESNLAARVQVHVIASVDDRGTIAVDGKTPRRLMCGGQRVAIDTIVGPATVVLSERALKQFDGNPPGNGRVIILSRRGPRALMARTAVAFAHSPDIVLRDCLGRGEPRVYVLGGAAVYAAFLPFATCAHIFVLEAPLALPNACVPLLFPAHCCEPLFVEIADGPRAVSVDSTCWYRQETHHFAADAHSDECLAIARATFASLALTDNVEPRASAELTIQPRTALDSDDVDVVRLIKRQFDVFATEGLARQLGDVTPPEAVRPSKQHRIEPYGAVELHEFYASTLSAAADSDEAENKSDGIDEIGPRALSTSITALRTEEIDCADRSPVTDWSDDYDDYNTDEDEYEYDDDNGNNDDGDDDDYDNEADNENEPLCGMVNAKEWDTSTDFDKRLGCCMVSKLAHFTVGSKLPAAIVARLSAPDALALARSSFTAHAAVAYVMEESRANPCTGVLGYQLLAPNGQRGPCLGALHIMTRVLPRISTMVKRFCDHVERACTSRFGRHACVSVCYPPRAIERAFVWAVASGCGAALGTLDFAAGEMRRLCLQYARQYGAPDTLPTHGPDEICRWLISATGARFDSTVCGVEVDSRLDRASARETTLALALRLGCADGWAPPLALARAAGRLTCASLLQVALQLAERDVTLCLPFSVDGSIVVGAGADDGIPDVATHRAQVAACIILYCLRGMASGRTRDDPPYHPQESAAQAAANIVHVLHTAVLADVHSVQHEPLKPSLWRARVHDTLVAAWYAASDCSCIYAHDPDFTERMAALFGGLITAMARNATARAAHQTAARREGRALDAAEKSTTAAYNTFTLWYECARGIHQNIYAQFQREPLGPGRVAPARLFLDALSCPYSSRMATIDASAYRDAPSATDNVVSRLYDVEPILAESIVHMLCKDDRLALACASRSSCRCVCAITLAKIDRRARRADPACDVEKSTGTKGIFDSLPSNLSVAEGLALLVLLWRRMPAISRAMAFVSMLADAAGDECACAVAYATALNLSNHDAIARTRRQLEDARIIMRQRLDRLADATGGDGRVLVSWLVSAAAVAAAVGLGAALAKCVESARRMHAWTTVWRWQARQESPRAFEDARLHRAIMDWVVKGWDEQAGDPFTTSATTVTFSGNLAWLPPSRLAEITGRTGSARMLVAAATLSRDSLSSLLGEYPVTPAIQAHRLVRAEVELVRAVSRGMAVGRMSCDPPRAVSPLSDPFLSAVGVCLFSWHDGVALAPNDGKDPQTDATVVGHQLIARLKVERCGLILLLLTHGAGGAFDTERARLLALLDAQLSTADEVATNPIAPE